jgi:putative endonuclease
MTKHCPYILTNHNNKVFYTGVSSNLKKRIWQHKEKLVDGFTKRYNVCKLVYFEIYDNPRMAIKREKQIKNLLRKKKLL